MEKKEEKRGDALDRAKAAAADAPELERALKRAMVKTNLMFALLQVCSDYVVDIDMELDALHCRVNGQHRRDLGMVYKIAKDLRVRMKWLCRVAWGKSDVDEQVELADSVELLKGLFITAMRKVGKDSQRMESIIKLIESRYKTILPLKSEDYID